MRRCFPVWRARGAGLVSTHHGPRGGARYLATRFRMRQRQARGGLGPRDSKLLVISDRISKKRLHCGDDVQGGAPGLARAVAVLIGIAADGQPQAALGQVISHVPPRTWRGRRPSGRSGTGPQSNTKSKGRPEIWDSRKFHGQELAVRAGVRGSFCAPGRWPFR